MTFSLLKKMSTAVRGLAHEAGEEIVDSQGIRIFEQEIRDASVELDKAKTSLAELVGKKKVQQRKADVIKTDINKYTKAAKEALEKNNEGIAVECAEAIEQLEQDLVSPEAMVQEFAEQETKLKSWVKQSENQLKRLQREIDSVKAVEQVQRARAAVASKYSGADSGLSSAADSLARIKQKQEERSAQFDAAQELADGDSNNLDVKLKAAGIGSSKRSAKDILADLKKKD